MARIIKPRKAVRWTSKAQRSDIPQLQSWSRASVKVENEAPQDPTSRFAKYNVRVDIPEYDNETYEAHLTNNEWSKEETDYLLEVYRDCNGKWPVIIDHFDFEGGPERSMEDLKSRFYSISATLLQLTTPISSMTATDFGMFETLKNFNPAQEMSRKKLAEGHLYRRANEVDEETVLLNELQRIMLNQATLDSQREELRRRLDYPAGSTGGFQYTTSQALTQLWQQLLHQDRMKKNPRLRATGNPNIDGYSLTTPTTATQGRNRDSITGQSEASVAMQQSRRPTRDSLPSATPQSALPSDLSKSDMLRFGVVQQTEPKLPNGVTFAGDKLSKPRIAKSTIQTEKIGAILTSVGVPELIALPTQSVIESFEQVMQKVNALLELRKIGEKEEQELRVRTAEAEAG